MDAGFADSVKTSLIVSSMWTASFNLGACVGPTLAGFITDYWGFKWACLVFFCIYSTMIVVDILQMMFAKRSSKASSNEESA